MTCWASAWSRIFCKDGLLHVYANDLPAWCKFFRYSKRVVNRKAGPNVRNRRAWVKAKGIIHLRVKLIELRVGGLLSEGKTRC